MVRLVKVGESAYFWDHRCRYVRGLKIRIPKMNSITIKMSSPWNDTRRDLKRSNYIPLYKNVVARGTATVERSRTLVSVRGSAVRIPCLAFIFSEKTNLYIFFDHFWEKLHHIYRIYALKWLKKLWDLSWLKRHIFGIKR